MVQVSMWRPYLKSCGTMWSAFASLRSLRPALAPTQLLARSFSKRAAAPTPQRRVADGAAPQVPLEECDEAPAAHVQARAQGLLQGRGLAVHGAAHEQGQVHRRRAQGRAPRAPPRPRRRRAPRRSRAPARRSCRTSRASRSSPTSPPASRRCPTRSRPSCDGEAAKARSGPARRVTRLGVRLRGRAAAVPAHYVRAIRPGPRRRRRGGRAPRSSRARLEAPSRGGAGTTTASRRGANISRRRDMLKAASTWTSTSNLALQQGPQHSRLPFKRDLNTAAHALPRTSDAPPTP